MTKQKYKCILTQDYVFSSPSTAATIILGRNANGLKEWKMEDGKTLKEFEAPEDNTEKLF